MATKFYYIGIRTRDGRAVIRDYDPETRKNIYQFAFGPFFSWGEAVKWRRHWNLRLGACIEQNAIIETQR